MVVSVTQLRRSIQLLRFVWWSLVDSRIEIDQVLAGLARCREVDDHIALAVESACIAHIGVVVGSDVDVVVFGPANALEVNRHGRARRARLRRHAHDAGFDREKRAPLYAIAALQRYSVQATQILRNRYRQFNFSVAAHLDLRNHFLFRFESQTAHAAAGPAARNRATAEPRVLAADTHPRLLLSQLTAHVLSMVRQPSPLTFSSIGVPTGPEVGVSSKVCVTSMPFCATAFPSMVAITSCTPP